MTAEVDRPDPSANGVIVASGTQNQGFSWYIKEGKMVFDGNSYTEHQVVRSEQELPVGTSTLGVLFTWQEEKGTITLQLDGADCGSMVLPSVVRGSSSGMSVGRDNLSPVTADYVAPFDFAGTIHRVDVKLAPFKSSSDEKAEAEARFQDEMSRQ